MNNKIIVLYPENQENIVNILKYNFKDTDFLSVPELYTPFDREELAKKINSTYDQVYFYDYYNQFYLLLPLISKKIKRKYIINNSISMFNNQCFFSMFIQLRNYLRQGLLDVIGSTSYELTKVFKDIKYIQFDLDVKIKQNGNNKISILSYDYDEKCNFYNQLAAISLTNYKDVNIINELAVTTNFANTFNLNLNLKKNITELLEDSLLSLYVNFTDIDPYIFILSMDNNIPCLLGNTSLIDNTKIMKEYLCVESDDSVVEISDKINECIKNKNIIFDEYNKWRKDYSKKCIGLIKEFIDI